MTKTIEVVYENGVFKPLEKVELKLKEGEKVDIRIEDEKVVTRKIEHSLREYNDFLPRDFNFTLEKLRTDSRDRFKRLGIIP
jgi:predicted DNA-binding antitoxin AbrB/MazE fold protein